MIKEIQEITNKLIDLNLLVYKEIFSTEDLGILENAKKAISLIKEEIDCLLHNASHLSTEDTDAFMVTLTKIAHLLSLQAIAINEISTLSVKFIRNYRKKWNSPEDNIA